jgi:hypothetical protein
LLADGSCPFKAFTYNGPKAALRRSMVLERTRAPGAVGPGFRLFCRRYAKPPPATLLTGLAGGERLSQFLPQQVCPFDFGHFYSTTQELSPPEISRL